MQTYEKLANPGEAVGFLGCRGKNLTRRGEIQGGLDPHRSFALGHLKHSVLLHGNIGGGGGGHEHF